MYKIGQITPVIRSPLILPSWRWHPSMGSPWLPNHPTNHSLPWHPRCDVDAARHQQWWNHIHVPKADPRSILWYSSWLSAGRDFLLLEQICMTSKKRCGMFWGLWFQSYKIEQFASGLTNESMVNDYLGRKHSRKQNTSSWWFQPILKKMKKY